MGRGKWGKLSPDSVAQRGLLDEVLKLRQRIQQVYGDEMAVDHEEGIFQSIGASLICAAVCMSSLTEDTTRLLQAQASKNSHRSLPPHSPRQIHTLKPALTA